MLLAVSSPSVAAKFESISTAPNADRLIVFVHGIGGDASTFGDWPQQLKADKTHVDIGPPLGDYAIAHITYESGGGTTYTGQELATQVADVLRRDVTAKYRHVYVVTHSLGGILVKKALIDLHRPEANQAAQLKSIKAVMFFGTPSDGAKSAKAASLLAGVGLVFGKVADDLRNISSNSWLQSIEADWKQLYEGRTSANFRVYCAYERLPYKGFMIVPQERIDRRCDDATFGFDEDHGSLVEPKSAAGKTAAVFDWARNRIVDAQRSRGRIVLAMDSSPNAYAASLKNAGKSNSVVYRSELDKLKAVDNIQVDVEPLTTYQGWNEEVLVFRKDLALLLIHLSAFEFGTRKCLDQLGMNCSGPVFFPFLRNVLRINVPVIIYSRLDMCIPGRARKVMAPTSTRKAMWNAPRRTWAAARPRWHASRPPTRSPTTSS